MYSPASRKVMSSPPAPMLGGLFFADNCQSSKASFNFFRKAPTTSADSEVRNDPLSDSENQVANPLGGREARLD
jgi:hypothetical protein